MAVRTTVVAGTAAAVGARAGARQAASAPPPAEAAAPPAAPQPAPAAAEAPDRIAQLTQLAALKDSGALTEAEFASEKAKLLG
jgi:hypothetical protein